MMDGSNPQLTKETGQSALLVYTVFAWLATSTVLLLINFEFNWLGHGNQLWYLLLIIKSILEIIGIFYAVSFTAISIAYLLSDNNPKARRGLQLRPPVGVIYLCCEDINEQAIRSLCSLEYTGKLYLIIHDDSQRLESQAQVDAVVAKISHEFPGSVLLLRRTKKEWGKPGAVNFVIRNTSHLFDYFLLCDSDSFAITPDAIDKALAHFAPRVAIVQFRNTSMVDQHGPWVNQVLSEVIDVFDVFLTTGTRWGWQPFLGHNAMLSTKAFLEIGGMKPFFADDIDLSLRLNLCGYKTVYANEIVFGEEHPTSYLAFRTRIYKWSFGCMQILREHTLSILMSNNLDVSEKWYAFLVSWFYVVQGLLILYLGISYVLLPLLAASVGLELWQTLLGDILIMITIFAYSWAFFLKKKWGFIKWARFAFICAVVYGGTGIVSIIGIWDCLASKKRGWIPTNSSHSHTDHLPVFIEPLLGVSLLLVPYIGLHVLPSSPLIYLFAGVYLAVPLIAQLY